MEQDRTHSLCPVCLAKIPARRVVDGHVVKLVKTCPDHGGFSTVIWKGPPDMNAWQRPKTPSPVDSILKKVEKGCPFDCGLCRDHRQRSCTVLLEVTGRCNLNCPVCFADSGPAKKQDPSLSEIGQWFETVKTLAKGSNIQISGGEPTVRDDLPEIVATGRKAGFDFIQLNTNGIRLADDPDFVRDLKDAGLTSLFLQFDGISDDAYVKLRGKKLADVKKRAVEICAGNGLGVVLVPTLVPGMNIDQIGPVLRYAVDHAPAVRGVHFQPVSYFGRHPGSMENAPRISLPEVMRAIEDQTGGMFKTEEFAPPGCENAWCSFHADYLVVEDRKVRPLHGQGGQNRCCAPVSAKQGAMRAISAVCRQWAAPKGEIPLQPDCGCKGPDEKDKSPRPSCSCMSLDEFIARARTHTFSVSAMAFQDVWTLDLARVRDCCIHVFDPRFGLVPFCAYNVSAMDGKTLYR